MSGRPVALVVGASQGIGRATAVDLARHGHDVAVAARRLEAGGDGWSATATAAELARYGARALPVRLDVADQASVRQGVEVVLGELGRIDVLVVCANWVDFEPGGTYVSELATMRWDSIEGHIATVATGHLLLLRLVLPGMVERRRGLVVNITQNQLSTRRPPRLPMVDEPPMMERLTEPEGARPGAGQGGAMVPIMRGLTERIAPALRRELEPYGVTVCTVDPSMTRSNPGADYYATLERVGFTPAIAHSVLVTARTVAYLATCRNPAVFHGRFVVAEDLVRTFGLMTESDIYPDEFPALDALPTLSEPPAV